MRSKIFLFSEAQRNFRKEFFIQLKRKATAQLEIKIFGPIHSSIKLP